MFDKSEVERKYTRGSGNGGQHRNKVESCVFLKHLPTGITVKVQDERDRHKNEILAWKRLEEKLREIHDNSENKTYKQNMLNLTGMGNRGEKVRTYNEKQDLVYDLRTNKSINFKELYKGRIDRLK